MVEQMPTLPPCWWRRYGRFCLATSKSLAVGVRAALPMAARLCAVHLGSFHLQCTAVGVGVWAASPTSSTTLGRGVSRLCCE